MMDIRFITSHTFFRYVQMRSPSASSIYSQMALPVSLVQRRISSIVRQG